MPNPKSLTLLLAGVVTLTPVDAQIDLQAVAEVGDPAPDSPAGTVFEDFGTLPAVERYFGPNDLDRPRIGRRGSVTFHAFLGDDGVPDDEFFSAGHLYRLVQGELQRIAGVGDTVPGFDARFTFFPSVFPQTPHVHDGRVSFSATTEGTPAGNRVFTDRFGPLVPTVGAGDRLPGMFPGATVGEFVTFAAGETIFYSLRIENPSVSDRDPLGIWRDRGGAVELVGATGTPAPGFADGIVFGQADGQHYGPLIHIDFDERGRVALAGAVRGPGIELENDEAIWVEDDAGLALLVREGDRVPGGPFPTKAVFQSGSISAGAFAAPGTPGIRRTRDGTVLFWAQVDPGKNAARVPSLWTTRGGSLTHFLSGTQTGVADSEPGSPVPGIPDGTFTAFRTGDINDRGDIVVRAFARDVDDIFSFFDGVWVDRAGTLDLVALVGGPVPDNPGSTLLSIGDVLLERDGTVFYTAAYDRGERTFVGLFGNAADGTSRLVFTTGGLAAIHGTAGPPSRFIASFKLGRGTSQLGEKAVEVAFEDGSAGIYTAALLDAGPPTDTTAPDRPGPPDAVDQGGVVVLDWPQNSEEDLKQYRVERSAAGGPFVTIGVADRPAFRDASAQAGATHVYAIRAEDRTGNVSDPSSPVSIVPGDVEPLAVHVAAIAVDLVNGGFRGNRRARARVTIVDALGAPVSGALVNGEFRSGGSFGFDEDVVAISGADGVAEMVTVGTSKVNLDFEFCVTAVGGTDLAYRPEDNAVTCAASGSTAGAKASAEQSSTSRRRHGTGRTVACAGQAHPQTIVAVRLGNDGQLEGDCLLPGGTRN